MTAARLTSFEENFDAVPTLWNNRAGSGTESVVALGGGNNAYQSAGYRWRAHKNNIVFDPDKLYRIKIRVRRTATTDALKQFLYCGVEGVAADGVTLVNINGLDQSGNQHYIAAAGVDASAWTVNVWQEFTGYFRGTAATGSGQSPDINNPGKLHTNVRYFRPLFIVNYVDGPVGNVMQIDYILVEEVWATGQVTAERAEFVHLLEFEFSSGNVRLSTGVQDLSWNGVAWDAVGGLLEFGGIEETGDVKGQGVDVRLSGVDQTIISTLLNNQYRGRPVRIWRAHLDSVLGTIVPDPVLLFQGLQLGTYEVEEERERDVGTVRISTRVSGYLGMDRIRGFKANIVSHQHQFTGDKFFQHVAKLASQKIYWGTPVPREPGKRRQRPPHS